jgi:hypothetical protein
VGRKSSTKRTSETKKLLKKWGIGQVETVKWEEVANV